MFSPVALDLERGWPGRIEGDRVVQLAAQTLQAFFTGGGQAREHAEFPLADVALRAPVLSPPSVRVYRDDALGFANPASIYGPDATVPFPARTLLLEVALAAVIGADGAIGGFTVMNDWSAPELGAVKDRDFATSLGPVVVTPDDFDGARAAYVVRVNGVEVAQAALHPGDWPELVAYAARNTRLLPGDVIAVGGADPVEVLAGDVVELDVERVGVLRNYVAAPA
jgi:hypothetical protein